MPGSTPSPDPVIARLRAGDERAFDEIMRAYQDALQRYIFRIAGSADTAADVTQEVFVRVWESRETLQIRGSLRGYLFRAARNIAFNLAESDTARTHREAEVSATDPVDVSDAASAVETKDFEAAVRAAIAALPPGCREIFTTVRDNDLTYPEAAETLGVSLSTVKTQMGRAMTTLAARLAPFMAVLLVLQK